MSGPEGQRARVLFDVSRLLTRQNAAPTGIDRVDFAYLRALYQAPDIELRLIRFGAFGPALLGQQAAAELIAAIDRRWRAQAQWRGPQERFGQLRSWLESPAGTPRPELSPPRAAKALRALPRIGKAIPRPQLPARTGRLPSAGRPWIYLNTSHGRLFRPSVSRWLASAPVKPVFFIHDLIPIEYPEFNRPLEPARHAARIQVVSNHARRVLVNSMATQSALERHLVAQGMRVPPVSVLPLGVEPRLFGAETATALHPTVPYFMVLSTIEPRKNHQLLLEVWRRLVENDGPAAPRLLILGRRGWENQNVFNLLDRTPGLMRHAVECSDLSDSQLALLLRGTRALLSPSYAEGYGLPVVEALAAGVPVLASSIEAHREIGGAYAEYLDPLDGLGWLDAVLDYARADGSRRDAQLRRLRGYRPPQWDDHLSAALDLIRKVALEQFSQVPRTI